MRETIILSIFLWVVILFSAIKCAEAEAYVDLTISAHSQKDDIYVYKEKWNSVYEWKTPLASIEYGYQYKSVSFFIKHTSSLAQNYDDGLNEVGFRVRVAEND